MDIIDRTETRWAEAFKPTRQDLYGILKKQIQNYLEKGGSTDKLTANKPLEWNLFDMDNWTLKEANEVLRVTMEG